MIPYKTLDGASAENSRLSNDPLPEWFLLQRGLALLTPRNRRCPPS